MFIGHIGMSDWSDQEILSCAERKGKRPLRHLADSSSDSDISLPKSVKRKKTLRVTSDCDNSSSSSGVFYFRSKTRRIRVMSDASSSDSDVNPLVLRGGRKKVSRVVNITSSESESSEEEEEIDAQSDDETAQSSATDCNESGAFSDSVSEWETDWQSEQEEEDEDEEFQQAVHESLSSSKSASESTKTDQNAIAASGGFMSDSSDGQSEKCPICLISFTTQEIGTPESCDHSFCAVCLQEWSKNMNTCPVDRQPFTLILVRRHLEGKVIRKIPIEVRRANDAEEVDDPTFCEVCGRSDREDRLLLCDGCDLGYHMECLNPPLDTVPVEEWFCQECLTNNSQVAVEVDIQDGEVMDLLDDANQAGLGPLRPRTSRLLPRTRQSERVRATIRSLQRAMIEPAMQPSTSSGIESLGTESTASMSSVRNRHVASSLAPRKRRKGVRRKGTKKCRKRRITKASVKKEYEPDEKPSGIKKVGSSKLKTKRRKRRKTRRRKRKASRRTPRVVMPLSVKGRLAEQLGMCPPNRPGLLLPMIKSRPSSDIDLQRSRAGIPTLDLFGQREQLDYYSGSDDDGGNIALLSRPRLSNIGSTRLLANRKLLSASAVRSHTAITNSDPALRQVTVVHSDGDVSSKTPVDLVGSILDSQSIWHSNKAKITIGHDGSLKVRQDNSKGTLKKDIGCSASTIASGNDNVSSAIARNDRRISEMTDVGNLAVNKVDTSRQITQAPMYPGRGSSGSGGSRQQSGGGGFHQFSGNRYSNNSNVGSPSYQNYQANRGYSSFPSSGFDPHSTRAGYANYLNSGHPLPFRGSPMRFRLSPRFPLRRPPGPPPGVSQISPPRPVSHLPKQEENKPEDSEGGQKPQDDEEDEIDIYSDIELGGAGSGAQSGGGSEPDEGDRSMDVSYEALPPPPEPSALLMGLGEQVLSDEEPASDSELVIDDNVIPNSPHDQADSIPQIPESEKYDPAEPSYDSDEDLPLPTTQRATSNNDIPCPLMLSKSPPNLAVPQHMLNSSSNSNISYLHSPSYGEHSAFDSENKLSSVTADGVVNQVVKEVLKERLTSTSALLNVTMGSTVNMRHTSADQEEEETEECPNFSIYSALSMDIARKTGEEQNSGQRDTEAENNGNSMVADEKSEENIPSPKKEKEKDSEVGAFTDKGKGVDDSSKSHFTDHGQEKPFEKDHDKKEPVIGDSVEDSSEHVKENFAECTSEHENNLEELSEISDKVGDEIDHSDVSDNVGSAGMQSCSHSELSKFPNVESCAGDGKNEGLLIEETLGSDDNDSLIGGATSAVSAATIDNNLPASTPLGLEGLDTETISETEEAINFDDISQDGNGFLTVEEDGEIPSVKKKKKRKSRKLSGGTSKDSVELEAGKEMTPNEAVDYEEGEIVDDRPKMIDITKKEKKNMENEKSRHEKDSHKSSEENFDVSKPKSVIEDEKKKKKKKTNEKGRTSRERMILTSSENKDKMREKARRSEENSISWKKPSKSTKGRNYRDSKAAKTEDIICKEKESEKKTVGVKDTGCKKEKKKKEKRKDMERYDVRKVVSDKKRKRRDEFGRDLSREHSFSRSRSRSHRRSRDRSRLRSRSLSRPKNNRSKARSPVRSRLNRSRSRSRIRSRSRSHNRSRSRSRNRSKRRSKDRIRKSRSKERLRTRLSRSRSRGKRSRTRSRSRSKNRQRLRSRSRSVVRSRDRKERTRSLKDALRFHMRRSWSRTWTPSWSRSRSHSLSCSSYSHSRSPSIRHFNRSYTRSFSRSWSRERHERIPVLEKKTGAMSKTPKKLTVIVSNTKDDTERQRKKEKKRKENRKNKDQVVAVEKRKKRKEKSPAPSKEVFTSGDNILVSVNFNKSTKAPPVKDIPSTSLSALPKETTKRKRDDAFEPDREPGKKARKDKVPKDKGSPRMKAVANTEKTVMRSIGEKKSKKQSTKANKSARMVAILKQKPVAIIDLDQSPFHEQTPSPTDLIILSDSDDEPGNKEGAREEMVDSVSSRRGIRPTSASPQASSKAVHNVTTSIPTTRTPESQSPLMSAISSYLVTTTGPKTPPEPQVKFSIAAKPQLRSINNPLREEDDDMLVEDAGLDDSDQRIEEELDRGLGDIIHKGPNTPPEPRGPSTPCSPPTSPDAYDPFDPTKSGTPSPAGPEASMDGPPSPTGTPTEDLLPRSAAGGGSAGGRDSVMASDLEDMVNKPVECRSKSPTLQSSEEITEERSQSPDRMKPTSRGDPILTKSPSGIPESTIPSQIASDELSQSGDLLEGLEKAKSKSSIVLSTNTTTVSVTECNSKSPERKISVVITSQQPKLQGTPVKQQMFPVTNLKQVPTSQQPVTSTPSHSNAPTPLFPTLTPANIASILCTPSTNMSLGRTNLFNTPVPIAVPPLMHHHVGSSPAMPPTRMPTDKAVTRIPLEKVQSSAIPLRSMVQNGEQAQKQPQDTTTEVVDMDLDSPYSPGSSEGDDLFEPPVDTSVKSNQSYSTERNRSAPQNAKNSNKLLGLPLTTMPVHKSPSKPPQDKFDSLFGMSPLRVNKPSTAAASAAPRAAGRQQKAHHKSSKGKTGKHGKGGRKEIAIKMDEDQLQILDDLPSSAVELQVKDKFLKKLNRQERVVEEVKLSLKPHYTKKHITKEEYKEILRRSVPKICHNKSGEINPIKISSLVEAYVRKYRYAKKKNANAGANSAPTKTKVAKPTMWS